MLKPFLSLTSGKCPACPLFSDKEGNHAISCDSQQGERIAKHNQLQDLLYQTVVSAALGPTREDQALIPGTEQRPADVLTVWARHSSDQVTSHNWLSSTPPRTVTKPQLLELDSTW